MLKSVRKFINERSPNWLSVEVDRNCIRNFKEVLSEQRAVDSVQPAKNEDLLTNKNSLRLNNGSLATTKGKPHWRRIKQVFEVLDEAPQGATYAQLIEYVREATGTGCSRKLISKWKKERQLVSELKSPEVETRKLEVSEQSDDCLTPARTAHGGEFDSLPMSSAVATTQKESNLQASSLVETSLNYEDISAFKEREAKPRIQLPSWWSYATATVMVAGLVGCDLLPTQLEGINPQKDTAIASIEPQGIPGAVPPVKRRSQKLEPRTIKISLTLSNPQDLKVKPGEEVDVGEVLSDRTSERDRLMAKKQQLELSLKKLDVALTAPIPPKPVPKIEELPPVSYAEEEAKIKLKSQNLKEAEEAVAHQQKKIEELQNLLEAAADDSAREQINLIIEHERAKLENLQAAVAEAQIQLQMSQAQLATAKEKRAYAEHQQQLEKNRRVMATEQQRLEVQQQEQQRQRQLQTMEYNLAQLRAQIQEVENAVAQLGQVKSPYPGVVKKIKWVGQSDNVLTAELTLAVTGAESAITKPDTTG